MSGARRFNAMICDMRGWLTLARRDNSIMSVRFAGSQHLLIVNRECHQAGDSRDAGRWLGLARVIAVGVVRPDGFPTAGDDLDVQFSFDGNHAASSGSGARFSSDAMPLE